MNEDFKTDSFINALNIRARNEFIDDGTLIDVTDTKEAKEVGIKSPVAVSSIVWDIYIEWTGADSRRQTDQAETARLMDVLWMFHLSYLSEKSRCFLYSFEVILRDGQEKKAVTRQLKAVIEGGRNGEPLITIMMPYEDY